MVYVNAALLLISGACGARVSQVTEANETKFPVPKPNGYTFHEHDVYRCYGGVHPLSNIPPGYKVHTTSMCPGENVLYWNFTGTNSTKPSHWGSPRAGRGGKFKDPIECAKECNKHEECAGFYPKRGVCSHWRMGELQDAPMREVHGYECYVKWEVRDLSGVETEPPEDEPAPPGPVPEPPQGEPQVSDCLCVWDVDRTLTAKQGLTHCNGTKHYEDVQDYAYNGGTLILSELAVRLKESFCGQCYFAAVSAGTASGPSSENRKLVDSLVDPKYNVGGWVDGCPDPVWGTKVMCCGEGDEKLGAVRNIVTWMGDHGIKIADEKVHFFDDKPNNIVGFEGSSFNAHQVSCASRDGSRGGCGGMISEVVDRTGQNKCP